MQEQSSECGGWLKLLLVQRVQYQNWPQTHSHLPDAWAPSIVKLKRGCCLGLFCVGL